MAPATRAARFAMANGRGFICFIRRLDCTIADAFVTIVINITLDKGTSLRSPSKQSAISGAHIYNIMYRMEATARLNHSTEL